MALNPYNFPAEYRQAIIDLNDRIAKKELLHQMLDRVLDEFFDLPSEKQIQLAFSAMRWAYVDFANEMNISECETLFCLDVEECFYSTLPKKGFSEAELKVPRQQVSALIKLVIGDANRKAHDTTLNLLEESEKANPRIGVKTALELEAFLRTRFIAHLYPEHLYELINSCLGFCYKVQRADAGSVTLSDALYDGTFRLFHETIVPMMEYVLERIKSGELKFDDNGIIVLT